MEFLAHHEQNNYVQTISSKAFFGKTISYKISCSKDISDTKVLRDCSRQKAIAASLGAASSSCTLRAPQSAKVGGRFISLYEVDEISPNDMEQG